MEAQIKSDKLIITMPLTMDGDKVKLHDSKSGKTEIVASTGGNLQTALQVGGRNVVIGLNAYVPKI